MINPRLSAVWSMTKPIAPFLCTPRVQEVHTKAEVVHLTPCLLGLGVLFNGHFPHKLKYVRHAIMALKLLVRSLPAAHTAAKRLRFVYKSMAMILFFEIRALVRHTVLSILVNALIN